jgi:hypothetical protein
MSSAFRCAVTSVDFCPDPDFLNCLGLDPDLDPSLYQNCTNFFQQENFGPKVALKSYGKSLLTVSYLYFKVFIILLSTKRLKIC